jgi:hypothetical protein
VGWTSVFAVAGLVSVDAEWKEGLTDAVAWG